MPNWIEPIWVIVIFTRLPASTVWSAITVLPDVVFAATDTVPSDVTPSKNSKIAAWPVGAS